jgi:hypothetical protein
MCAWNTIKPHICRQGRLRPGAEFITAHLLYTFSSHASRAATGEILGIDYLE